MLETNGTENLPTQVEKEKEFNVKWNFRRILPQILACTANNFILFDNGLVLSFPTIVIAALLHNTDGDLSFNEEQASWFASISLLCQPIGSIFSGLVMEPLGRKRSMLLLNIPFFTAWSMLFYADSITMLYVAAAIMGFGVGCTEAPILTYVGEISEPQYRGTLTSYAQFCGFTAYVMVYFIGSLTTWRYTAAICSAVPIITLLVISQVPETPLWLVSRNKIKRAEESLCWLRGWVKPEEIREELNHLIKYHATMNTADNKPSTESQEILIGEHTGFKQKIIFFLRPQMRRPLVLIISYFFFYYASGLPTFRPYLAPVVKDLQIASETKDINNATVLVALLGLLGYAVCMFSVSQIGKRALSLVSLIGSVICAFTLAAVAGGVLSNSWSLPILLTMSFISCVGLAPIPWMLQSELYPFHGKCLAAGIAAAASYIIGFFATKTFLSLESILGLSGVFILFGCLSLLGTIYIYMRLPETEGRTFEEIEATFLKPNIKK